MAGFMEAFVNWMELADVNECYPKRGWSGFIDCAFNGIF